MCFDSDCQRLATVPVATVDMVSVHIWSRYLNPAFEVLKCALRNPGTI